MSGTGFTGTNLACIPYTNNDVFYPSDVSYTGPSGCIPAFATSLFSISTVTNTVNAFTVNMQYIDSPGSTGSVYYANRVNVSVASGAAQIYYGNIKLYAIKLA